MSNLIAWVVAHSALVASLVIAVVDFVIGVNPNLASNSIVELILVGLKKLIPGSSS
jgi:hypothetical protein